MNNARNYLLLILVGLSSTQAALAQSCPGSGADYCYCMYEAGLANIVSTYGNDAVAAKPAVLAVKQQLDECLSPSAKASPKPGPLGLQNMTAEQGAAAQAGQAGELKITLTTEAVGVALERWREYKRTADSAPAHNPKHDAKSCLGMDWQDKNPAEFEYGRIYNKCSYPIHVAYCSVGVDCEANKGSLRTLDPGEASRYGERDHQMVKFAACTGRLYPIGQLTQYSCE